MAKTQKGNTWQLQEAKARLSEVLRRAREKGPQKVTVHGRLAGVVISADQFERREKKKKPQETLWEFFRNSPLVGAGIDLEREQDFGRDIDL